VKGNKEDRARLLFEKRQEAEGTNLKYWKFDFNVGQLFYSKGEPTLE